MSEKQTGIQLIEAERRRQIEKENWTSEHDDEHKNGDLRDAAEAYLLQLRRRGHWSEKNMPEMWPWDRRFWKPSADPIRQLVKAGALIAAEIDRLQRNNPMTIDQLTKLTDEEVRVRVATSVGWTHVEKRWGNGEKILTGLPPGKELSYGFHRVPVFARDLNAAFTLVEKLKDRWNCDIFCTPGSGWKVVFSRLNYADKLEEHAHEDLSLCRAICIPFLAVTERDEG